MSQPIDIAVAGALGRMGQAVATVISGRQDVRLAARFDRPGTAEDSLVEADAALAVAQVVIDFTTPAASVALAQSAAARGGPALVIGSTGCSEEQLAAIAQASKSIAIVHAGNYSLGVNMLMGMVAKAARAAGDKYVVFVADMYGKSIRPSNAEEAGAAATAVRADRPR